MRVGHGSFVVLEDVDLTVAGGEIAVTGVNGADEPTWYPGLSLHEHLELVRLTHEPVQGWCLPTDELIEVFGLAGRADAVPTDLSSGQRQRLSLAAALTRPSRLLLLDEPEQSLDPGFRKELAGLLRQYAGHGGTVVMATHDLDFAAAAGARLMLIADGRMTQPEPTGPGP